MQAKHQFRKSRTKSSKACSRTSNTTSRFVTATAFPPTVPTTRTSATTATTLRPLSTSADLMPIFNSTISSRSDLSYSIITSNHNTNTTTMPSITTTPVVTHNATVNNTTQSNGTTANIILSVLSKLIPGTN